MHGERQRESEGDIETYVHMCMHVCMDVKAFSSSSMKSVCVYSWKTKYWRYIANKSIEQTREIGSIAGLPDISTQYMVGSATPSTERSIKDD